MPCTRPLTGYRALIPNPNGKRSIVFNASEGFKDLPVKLPCGRCPDCKLEYSRQWAIRGSHELACFEDNCFITLTYADSHLPDYGQLVKKDFQDFMKRLRKHYEPRRIRYMMCGEYGEKFARPHFHAILFNLDFTDKQLLHRNHNGDNLYSSETLSKIWGKGLTSIGGATFESVAYVARYITKKVIGPDAEDHYEFLDYDGVVHERVKEYAHTSKKPGIGKTWLEKFKGDVFPRDYVVIRGKKMAPPKYYKSQLEKMDSEMHAVLSAQRKGIGIENRINELSGNPGDNSWDRLVVREIITVEKMTKLKRSIESA